MANTDRKKLTPQEIEQIISMRKNGISLLKLAALFKRDHSTITHHLKKAQAMPFQSLKPGPKLTPKRIQKSLKPELLPPEKINEGKKSYREYLEELAEKEGRPLRYYIYRGGKEKKDN